MSDVILASASPRRLSLLTQIGFTPRVRVSSIEERRAPDESPTEYTLRLAREKAQAVARGLDPQDPRFVLSADTIVVLGEEVLEKPADVQDAERMLRALSGQTHQVITAFCWLDRECDLLHVEAVSTDVTFLELSDETIARYAATGEPMDKAGAYGIQGIGGALVAGIQGWYASVVGLPIARVVAALRALGGLPQGFPFSVRS